MNRRQLFKMAFGAVAARFAPVPKPLLHCGTFMWGCYWNRELTKEEHLILFNAGEGLTYPFTDGGKP